MLLRASLLLFLCWRPSSASIIASHKWNLATVSLSKVSSGAGAKQATTLTEVHCASLASTLYVASAWNVYCYYGTTCVVAQGSNNKVFLGAPSGGVTCRTTDPTPPYLEFTQGTDLYFAVAVVANVVYSTATGLCWDNGMSLFEGFTGGSFNFTALRSYLIKHEITTNLFVWWYVYQSKYAWAGSVPIPANEYTTGVVPPTSPIPVVANSLGPTALYLDHTSGFLVSLGNKTSFTAGVLCTYKV